MGQEFVSAVMAMEKTHVPMRLALARRAIALANAQIVMVKEQWTIRWTSVVRKEDPDVGYAFRGSGIGHLQCFPEPYSRNQLEAVRGI